MGIFFALKGARFNGNLFAEQALKNGCKYAVVDEDVMRGHDQVIHVQDVLETLQQLANYHRKFFDIPVLAITGSNGKTTTKELMHAVLSKKFNTLATKGNFNNHIGVPLTLLSITRDHDLAIIEMGANHIGEIEKLCDITEPTHGMITNIGKAHLEGFGSLQGVIVAKTEMYKKVQEQQGLVFYNISNNILREEIKKYNVQTIAYQTVDDTDQAQYGGQKLESHPFLRCLLYGKNQGNQMEVNTQLTGGYNLENIVAAYCIGSHFNVPEEDIQESIESYSPANSRSQLVTTKTNKILLDSYNANATSMKLAIEDFLDDPSGQKKVMILGEMKELGDYAYQEHQHIVTFINKYPDLTVYFVGDHFVQLDAERSYPSTDDLLVALKKQPVKDGYVFLKGSRSVGLEKLLEVL